jgi:hypothetical protein
VEVCNRLPLDDPIPAGVITDRQRDDLDLDADLRQQARNTDRRSRASTVIVTLSMTKHDAAIRVPETSRLRAGNASPNHAPVAPSNAFLARRD